MAGKPKCVNMRAAYSCPHNKECVKYYCDLLEDRLNDQEENVRALMTKNNLMANNFGACRKEHLEMAQQLEELIVNKNRLAAELKAFSRTKKTAELKVCQSPAKTEPNVRTAVATGATILPSFHADGFGHDHEHHRSTKDVITKIKIKEDSKITNYTETEKALKEIEEIKRNLSEFLVFHN